MPLIREMDPSSTIITYISPSNIRVTLRNPAMLLYPMRFASRNLTFPSLNFSFSISSLAKDLATRIPSRLSSTWEFTSPSWLRCSLKAERILVRYFMAK